MERGAGRGETIWGFSTRQDFEISDLKCKRDAAVACCIPQPHSAACSWTAAMAHTVTFDLTTGMTLVLLV